MELKVEPEEICFDLDHPEPSAIIVIRNPTTSRKAFKVKTTMPRRYLVKPNQDVIEAESTVEVKITLQPKDATTIAEALREDPGVQEEMRDKFLIQCTNVSDEFADILERKENEENPAPMSELLAPLWSSTPQAQLKSSKFKCQFKHSKETGNPLNLDEMRKNYNVLVSQTMKLTTERDLLRNSFNEANKELEDLRRKIKDGTLEGSEVLQTKQGFTFFQVVAIAFLAFLSAMLLKLN